MNISVIASHQVAGQNKFRTGEDLLLSTSYERIRASGRPDRNPDDVPTTASPQQEATFREQMMVRKSANMRVNQIQDAQTALEVTKDTVAQVARAATGTSISLSQQTKEVVALGDMQSAKRAQMLSDAVQSSVQGIRQDGASAASMQAKYIEQSIHTMLSAA